MQYKNGVFSGTLIFFKSSIGIGLLVNQYFVGKCGLVWGLVITLGVASLMICVLDQMLLSTNKLEIEQRRKIRSMDEFAGNTFGRGTKLFCKGMILAYNEAVLLVNTINMCKFFQHQFMLVAPSSPLVRIEMVKFIVIMIFLLFLVFLVEPEKVKYVSFLSMFILFLALILMWGNSMDYYMKQ